MSGIRGTALRAAAILAVLAVAPQAHAQAPPASPVPQRRVFRELRRFAAPEARQAVAVDAGHFYAIGDREIGKYDKRTGDKVAQWRSPDDGPILHMNSGVVVDGRIYCAHSNFPDLPMTSSIEIFDSGSLTHSGSHSFGVTDGSATWIDRRVGGWWVTFAHYGKRGGEPGKGPERTSVVAYDQEWRSVGGYVFPPAVVKRMQPYSNSGGAWGAEDLLFATGHDAAEVYVLRLPATGSVLELVEVIPAPFAGQGIAWDPSEPGVLWGIVKARREVVSSRLVTESQPASKGD